MLDFNENCLTKTVITVKRRKFISSSWNKVLFFFLRGREYIAEGNEEIRSHRLIATKMIVETRDNNDRFATSSYKL